ncbi:MAG: TVP38/TMEM64 family protein [Candidatus Puniceispirillaceae bacterium]
MSSSHNRWSKWVLPAILIAGLIIFFASGTHRLLSFEALAYNYGSMKAFVQSQYLLAALIFFLVYLLSVAFSLPIALLLSMTGGALFGWPGAILILFAATGGAVIVFLAAKTIMSSMMAAKAGPFLKRLEAGFQENDFNYLLALRLVPVAPFWVINIVPALLGMSLSRYAIATFIGIAPGTFVYVYVAKGFDHILSQGKAPDLSTLSDWRIIGPLVALGLLALLPTIMRAIKKRRN